MEILNPELQRLVTSSLFWVIGSMSALIVSLFSVIGVILWFIAKQFIATANRWRDDLANDTSKLADKLTAIAVSFKDGLERVTEAVSKNREEYSGQISGQRERIAIIETKLDPLDSLYDECHGLKTRVDIIEKHFLTAVYEKDGKR